MIHILTVHWKDDRFIDIQLRYFQKNINQPYQIYTFLNYLPQDHSEKFFYASSEPIKSHAIKLNLLAEMAIFNAVSQDDILIFIDGDAFPIQPIMPWLYEKFKNYPLMAVKRFENDQDNHPHPLFCATTVGFWKEIKGDWKAGYYWQNPRGDLITDVGANLLKNLEDRKISWYPLLRSNKINYHPVNLGVYEDLIYHHGSGFRSSLTRKDLVDMNIFTRILDKLLMIIPSRKVEKKLASLISTRIKIKRNIINKNDQISQEIFDKIKQNPEFYREFI